MKQHDSRIFFNKQFIIFDSNYYKKYCICNNFDAKILKIFESKSISQTKQIRSNYKFFVM